VRLYYAYRREMRAGCRRFISRTVFTMKSDDESTLERVCFFVLCIWLRRTFYDR
jgi:hypothetical protein